MNATNGKPRDVGPILTNLHPGDAFFVTYCDHLGKEVVGRKLRYLGERVATIHFFGLAPVAMTDWAGFSDVATGRDGISVGIHRRDILALDPVR